MDCVKRVKKISLTTLNLTTKYRRGDLLHHRRLCLICSRAGLVSWLPALQLWLLHGRFFRKRSWVFVPSLLGISLLWKTDDQGAHPGRRSGAASLPVSDSPRQYVRHVRYRARTRPSDLPQERQCRRAAARKHVRTHPCLHSQER